MDAVKTALSVGTGTTSHPYWTPCPDSGRRARLPLTGWRTTPRATHRGLPPRPEVRLATLHPVVAAGAGHGLRVLPARRDRLRGALPPGVGAGPEQGRHADASVVYCSDGKTELGRFGDVNRESVPISQMPDNLQKAVLAAEDRSFYTNKGFSPKGIAPRRLGQAARRPTAGWLDDHPAVREELLPDPGPHGYRGRRRSSSSRSRSSRASPRTRSSRTT